MKVTVRLFAIAKEAAGGGSIDLELEEPVSVRIVRDALVARLPQLEPISSQLRFAVNEEFADDATLVQARDELACIPPVSGG